MKKTLSIMLLCTGLLLGLLSGCSQSAQKNVDAADEPESSVAAEENDIQVIRWAIMEEISDSSHGNLPYHAMDAGRMEKVNSLLQAKGYSFQLNMEYVLANDSQSELEQAAQSGDYDIVTFHSAGIGAEEMQQYLMPLEAYMQEGEVLHEVYSQFSEQVWQYDQIDGHTYNLGKLTEIVYPMYQIMVRNVQEMPKYSKEALRANEEGAVETVVEELGVGIKMAEPYVPAWGDEFGVQCEFHMIAPGVGLDLDGGTQFENVWESDQMQQWAEQELAWIENGTTVSTYNWDTWDNDKLFQRGIRTWAETSESLRDQTDGSKQYSGKIPVYSAGRLAPLLERQYTSVLKESQHTAESLQLLAALNTDPELFEALYTPTVNMVGNQPTYIFEELCAHWTMRGNENTLSERTEALSEQQISPILGFAFDQRPVQQEMAALWELIRSRQIQLDHTEIEEKAEQTGEDAQTIIAAAWREEFARFQARMREAGIERVIEEANRQLEAWQAER